MNDDFCSWNSFFFCLICIVILLNLLHSSNQNMKKITLLLAITLAGSTAFAQSERLVLFEEFTQASCPPCASTNPSLNAMLNAHPSEVVSIKYQTDWPGSDVMNVHNPAQVDTRVAYYSVTGVPGGELDGGVGFSGQPANMNYGDIAARYSTPSPFTIDVDFHLSATLDTLYGHAMIRCTEAVLGGVNVAHMVVIERNIYFTSANPPGTNGELEFEGVMKRMLPSDAGTPVASNWAIGDSMELNYAWKLANVYDINQLGLVVFIQNNTNKEVYQAGYMKPQMTNNAGVLDISGLAAIQCTPDVTPSVVLHNYAISDLTSVDINYYFDSNAPTVYNWTGTLAPDADVTITLPTLTPGTGSHVFHASTSNPNAGVDQDTHNDAEQRNTTIYSSNVTSPVSADFLAVAFPPAGFAVENVDGDSYTWARSAYGHNGAGSAKMNFYSAADGTIDNLYAPKFDFSNAIAGAQLTFEVAHAPYSSAYNDRIQVNVSSNCGATWTNVYDKAGSVLATTAATTSAYNPTAAQWRLETVSLDQFIGASELLVQFKGMSAYGNNAYIDNINITDGTVSVPVTLFNSGIELYPNPARNEAYLNANLAKASDLQVTLLNSIGAVVKTFAFESVTNQILKLDLTGLAKGTYVVNITSGSDVFNTRLNITE